MTRTTITLPDEMASALRREAQRRGTSVSEIAREALAARLRMDDTAGQPRPLSFAALGRSGSHDTARRSEQILADEWSPDRDR